MFGINSVEHWEHRPGLGERETISEGLTHPAEEGVSHVDPDVRRKWRSPSYL